MLPFFHRPMFEVEFKRGDTTTKVTVNNAYGLIGLAMVSGVVVVAIVMHPPAALSKSVGSALALKLKALPFFG